MPNWCDNKAIVVFKSAKAADEFIKACAEELVLPVPGTLLDLTEPKNLFQSNYNKIISDRTFPDGYLNYFWF